MSTRDLFTELKSALSDARQHDQGTLTLKTHHVRIPEELSITPNEIKKLDYHQSSAKQDFM